MKSKTQLRPLLLIASGILAASSSHAATLYWDGGSTDIAGNGNGSSAGGTGTWNTSLLNWDTGVAPYVAWGSGDYAVIAGTGATITVGSGIVTSGIDFTGNNYILDATSNGLGFTSGSNQIRLAGNNFAATINGAISGTGSMNFQAIHTGTLGFNPTPQVNFGGTSTGGWEGATTITRGIAVNLQDDNQALNSTNGITLNGGMIQLTNASATSITNNRINDSAAITVTGGGGFRIANTNTASQVYSEDIGNVTLNSGYLAFSYTTNLNTAGSTQTLTLNSFTRNNHGVVYFGPSANSAGVIKVTGATQTAANEIIGPWALSGNGNTIDDYAVFNASGQVVNRNATANNTETTWSTAWSATANQYINNVTSVNLTADRTFNTFMIRTTVNNAWSVGDFKLATYGLFVKQGNQTINAGTNGSITIPTDNSDSALYLATGGNGTLTVNAPIKDNGSTKLTLVLTGSHSVMTLNGDSSYTGGTVIARSMVRNSATAGSANLNIGHANAFGASTNFLKFDSGLLNLSTFNVTVGEFSGEASSYITASAGGTLTVGTGTPSASSTEFKGLITAGQIVKNGDGHLTLSGINTANATTAQYTVNGGTLQFAKVASFFGNTYNSANTGNWTKAKTIVNNGGTLAFNVGGTDEFTTGNVTTLLTNLGGLGASVAANEGLQSGSSIGLDTTNAPGNFTIADNLADSTGAGGGAIGLTKLGTGALELTGTNTYTGTTLVKAGTLLVNNTSGSGTGTGVVTVTAGTLGGNGIISGAVTIGDGTGSADAILAPGNSIDSLDTGDLSFLGDGSYAVELNGTSVTTDVTNVTGTVSINASTTLSVNLAGTLADNQQFLIVSNDGADAVGGTFAGLAQAAVVGNFGGKDLKISYTGGDGNDVVLYTEASGSSAYDTWKSANAPGSNPDDDTDGDGVPNAVEFVLGGTSATNDLDKLPQVATDGTNMTFTFNRKQSSIDPKTSLAIQVGTDLLDWTTGASPYAVPDGATAGPPVSVVKGVPANFDTVTLTIPMTPDTKKFARLKVIITP